MSMLLLPVTIALPADSPIAMFLLPCAPVAHTLLGAAPLTLKSASGPIATL